MGGGGGDGGYEARQQEQETKKQRARDALNAVFGQGSAESAARMVGDAPDRAKYQRPTRRLVSTGGDGDGAERWEDMPGVANTSTSPTWSSSQYWEAVRGGKPIPTGTQIVPDEAFGSGSFDQAGYDQATADFNKQVADKQASIGQSAQTRDSLYQRVRDNAYTAGKRGLDEGAEDARRKLKFELFATGNAGGSEDINQNARLKRTYDQGVMDLGAKADAAKADFRSDDENTRLQLLQSIDAGMDQGSALSSATARMQNAADKAAAEAQGTALGNLFDTGSEYFNQNQYSKGRQAGQEWWNTYSGGRGRSSASSKTGVSTRLPGE
jgi:hypothetical protein